MKKLLFIALIGLIALPAMAQSDVYFTPKWEKPQLSPGDHLIRSGTFQYLTILGGIATMITAKRAYTVFSGEVAAGRNPWGKSTAPVALAVVASAATAACTVASIHHTIKAGKTLNAITLTAAAHPTGATLVVNF